MTRLLSRRRPPFPVGYALVAFLIQIVGYAALLAVFAHGNATPLVVEIRALPTPVLGGIALLGAPAVALAVGLGAALSFALGIQPESLPAVFLANGDLLVFFSAAVLAVAVVAARRNAS